MLLEPELRRTQEPNTHLLKTKWLVRRSELVVMSQTLRKSVKTPRRLLLVFSSPVREVKLVRYEV